MSFGIWQRTITDETGNVLPASEIEVREPSVDFTGDIVELFSNETGTAGNANPFTADSEGFAQFYAAPRKVDIRATGSGSQRTWRNVEILGTAAIADTGTAPGEVPLNSDLPDFGTAAIADVQTGRADVATGKLATFPFAYSQGNILGTVSQSGGVPTGAIIERGSNSNGEYVKFADGTQICTRKVDWDNDITSTSTSGVFSGGTPSFDYPKSFSSIDHASISFSGGTPNKARNDVIGGKFDFGSSSTSMSTSSWRSIRIYAQESVTFASGESLGVYLSAIGRWY